jgi:hypothetical protein
MKQFTSVFDHYTEEQICAVLAYAENAVNNNTYHNSDYDLHCEWLITGDIRENIKRFVYLINKLERGD